MAMIEVLMMDCERSNIKEKYLKQRNSVEFRTLFRMFRLYFKRLYAKVVKLNGIFK